jgi:prevent-host-death family protein
MTQVNTHEAKTRLSRLLRRVAAGEEITIANRGVPVARLVPVPTAGTTRKLGFFRGQMTIADDFDAPLPEDVLDAFEGKTRRPKTKRKKS